MVKARFAQDLDSLVFRLVNKLEKAGKVAGWISNIKFGFGLFKSYKNDILNCAIEEITCELFMHEMASNSPDISENLYKFAKKKMNQLYYSGNLNIDYNFLGEINSYNAKDPLDIEVIRNDINNYKRELKYGLPNE